MEKLIFVSLSLVFLLFVFTFMDTMSDFKVETVRQALPELPTR